MFFANDPASIFSIAQKRMSLFVLLVLNRSTIHSTSSKEDHFASAGDPFKGGKKTIAIMISCNCTMNH
jgi:hypothetical protein